MAKAAVKKYYCYSLTDPRDLSVFYIGKGQAARATAHTHKVVVKDDDQSPKAARIRDILDAGEEVIVSIVRRFDDEDEALKFEAEMIERAGIDNLTNVLRQGGKTSKAKPAKKEDKLTLKQEGFVMSYIENGGNASQAYRDNYAVKKMTAKAVNEEACKLLAHPKVSQRVKAYQQRTQERHEENVDTLTARYWRAYEIAEETAQPGAMNGSVTGVAKLHGLHIEKSETNVNIAIGFAERLAKRRANG